MAANKTNHPTRRGVDIADWKGGRNTRLNGGKVTEEEMARLVALKAASGCKSWSDFYVWMADEIISETAWADKYFSLWQAQANHKMKADDGDSAGQ